MNTFIQLLIVSALMWFGVDLIVKWTMGPRIHQSYRRITKWILRQIWRFISHCATFIWTRYRQFVLGVATTLVVLLFTGRLIL